MTTPHNLPEEFLAAPASKITVSRINFVEAELPIYKDRYAIVLDNVLNADECNALLQAAQASTHRGWEPAMVNIGNGQQALYTDTRNCGRIIFDSHEIAMKVWKRIEHVPELQEIVRLENVPLIFGNGPIKRGEVWTFSRPNERMRFLKYIGGEYFRPHCDGSYEVPGGQERTYFTLHLYLNNAALYDQARLEGMTPRQRIDARKSALMGGATTFHDYDMVKRLDVLPKTGRVLLFQHRDLLHSGDDVMQGVKYTMRTDLLYKRESSKVEQRSKMPVLYEKPVNGNGEELGADGLAEATKYGFLQ